MKKIIFLLSVFFLTVTAGQVVAAACGGGTRLTGSEILTRFQNMLICARSTNNSDIWAEEHLLSVSNGGALWEHARGQGHPIDPRRQAGRWIIGTNPNGTIIYNYLGNPTGNPYEWSVWTNPNTRSGILFCTADGASSIAGAQVITLPDPAAANPCGFAAP